MKFTTGTNQINETVFTVKRIKDENLEFNYNVEVGKQIAKDKATGLPVYPVYMYHNVPESDVKIGENVYNESGDFYGYRAE